MIKEFKRKKETSITVNEMIKKIDKNGDRDDQRIRDIKRNR